MPAEGAGAPPKEQGKLSAEEDEQRKKDAAATVRMIGPLVFMIVTGGQLLNQSRPMLVNAITGGDTIRSAAMLARFAGLGGAAEFLLNPVIGRMSDRFGRRPLLLTSPITCAVLRGAVFAFPHSASLIMFERMLSSAVVTGFFSTMRAMLNDKLSMEELVVASGSISVYAGLGVMLGPFLETFVLTAFGARGNFLAVALINVVVSIVMARTAKETLPVSEQKSALPSFLTLITCRCYLKGLTRAVGRVYAGRSTSSTAAHSRSSRCCAPPPPTCG